MRVCRRKELGKETRLRGGGVLGTPLQEGHRCCCCGRGRGRFGYDAPKDRTPGEVEEDRRLEICALTLLTTVLVAVSTTTVALKVLKLLNDHVITIAMESSTPKELRIHQT
jgi:hypothetical protein